MTRLLTACDLAIAATNEFVAGTRKVVLGVPPGAHSSMVHGDLHQARSSRSQESLPDRNLRQEWIPAAAQRSYVIH